MDIYRNLYHGMTLDQLYVSVLSDEPMSEDQLMKNMETLARLGQRDAQWLVTFVDDNGGIKKLLETPHESRKLREPLARSLCFSCIFATVERRDLSLQSAQGGYPLGMYIHGGQFDFGSDEWCFWMEKSAKAGCPLAMAMLGSFHHANTALKTKYHRTAALAGESSSMMYYASICEDAGNFIEAAVWYGKRFSICRDELLFMSGQLELKVWDMYEKIKCDPQVNRNVYGVGKAIATYYAGLPEYAGKDRPVKERLERLYYLWKTQAQDAVMTWLLIAKHRLTMTLGTDIVRFEKSIALKIARLVWEDRDCQQMGNEKRARLE